MSDFFPLHPYLEHLADKAETECRSAFAHIQQVASYNGEKVLAAFTRNRVSEASFQGSTGYGYGDTGRDLLDKVWADVFQAEDALVRHNFVSGTHALTVALFGVLRPGDTMLAVTGKPYDTLHEVIGLQGKNGFGSLADYGVHYQQIDFLPDGRVNLPEISRQSPNVKIVYIQRSRGYSLRPALTVQQIADISAAAKQSNPDVIVMVDNCYGEFVETREPVQAGADLCIGSLIKNPGGGIAPTGGYIAGRRKLVELCAHRLTCPGVGREVGCTLGQSRALFMGLFFAPEVVANALKTATFAAQFFDMLGFPCMPSPSEQRGDIITVLQLKDPEHLKAFCQGIQKGAPVDAFVTPEPWDMPGYDSPVIMAAGAFTGGASIELSADAPLRPPYAAWMQGGLTYSTGRTGVLLAAQEMLDRNLIKIPQI